LERSDYDAIVLKRLAWRLFDLATLGFATLGFYYVPLGERTGYEHAHAIVTSPEAQQFAVGVVEAARDLRTKVRSRLLESAGLAPESPDAG
jgi:hypothetical protein